MQKNNPATTLLLPHRLFGNIYVRELGRAYQQQGIQAIFGPENLFESSIEPNIIHLHWPEEQYRGFMESSVERNIEQLLERLDRHKARGGRLIWTVHNLMPHEYADSDIDQLAYQGVIDRADVIMHHCACWEKLLAQKYRVPGLARTVISPHGHYLGYPNTVSQAEARERLGIDPNSIVYLHFGALRGYKGLDIVFQSFRRAKVANKRLVVAGRYQRDPGWRGRLDNLKMSTLEKFSRKTLIHPSSVARDDIQLYMNACDALVLGHRRGLNSGVAVLGITFGKLIIGPDIGCIGDVLKQGCNLVYPAGDREALTRAIEAVPGMDLDSIAGVNRALAEGWRWDSMATALLGALSTNQASVVGD